MIIKIFLNDLTRYLRVFSRLAMCYYKLYSSRLNAVKTDIISTIDEATKNTISYEEFLFTLLQRE